MSHKRFNNKTPKDEIRTPPALFKTIDERIGFTIDLAATPENALCPVFYQKDDAGGFLNPEEHLVAGERAWVNPPYSQGLIEKFVTKCHAESLNGAIVAMLISADMSTGWWDTCMLAAEWMRIKGRVVFNHYDGVPIEGSPAFASVIVIFNQHQRELNGGKIAVSELKWK